MAFIQKPFSTIFPVSPKSSNRCFCVKGRRKLSIRRAREVCRGEGVTTRCSSDASSAGGGTGATGLLGVRATGGEYTTASARCRFLSDPGWVPAVFPLSLEIILSTLRFVDGGSSLSSSASESSSSARSISRTGIPVASDTTGLGSFSGSFSSSVVGSQGGGATTSSVACAAGSSSASSMSGSGSASTGTASAGTSSGSAGTGSCSAGAGSGSADIISGSSVSGSG
mmetsp:Transcript_4651/g.7900  ORF Transcript_4651/g.7900 Transcript_4651/m.7900 type:complete len:226 (+) Transcript_4651:892-1569(+)